MTYLIDYWDEESQSQKQREASAVEIQQRAKDLEEVYRLSIPKTVTPRQARLAMLNAGVYQQVLDTVSSLPEPSKTRANIELEYSTAFNRDFSLVTSISEILGWSTEFVDNLFIEAAKL